MLTTIILVCIFIGRFSIFGFVFGGPCEVSPHFSDGATVEVPATCRNGTFWWDRPKGRMMLEFHNVHEAEIAICIKTGLLVPGFNITDKATNQRIGSFNQKNWECFQATTAQDIIFQVDARYPSGAFEYKITS